MEGQGPGSITAPRYTFSGAGISNPFRPRFTSNLFASASPMNCSLSGSKFNTEPRRKLMFATCASAEE